MTSSTETPPPPPTTTTKQRSELPSTCQIAEIGTRPEQLRFPAPAFTEVRPPRVRPARKPRSRDAQPDDLLATFRRRCAARHSAGTARQYAWAVKDILKLAAEFRARSLTLLDLFQDEEAIGVALTASRRAGGGAAISGWTAASRRTAIRAASQLLAPQLRDEGIADPGGVIERALRAHAERIGSGYRLPEPPSRSRGGAAPNPDTVVAVLDALEATPGWAGQRDRAIFETMFFTGVRVNAIRLLDGAHLRRLPDGSGRLSVHAKHPRDSGEFVLPPDSRARLEQYAADFNLWAAAKGISARVGAGLRGAFWRSVSGRTLGYASMCHSLEVACERAGVERLTPHAFRRAFATIATERLPRSTVASAGAWLGTRRMDDHYVQRSADSIWRRIGSARPREIDDAPFDEPTRTIKQVVGAQ